VLCLLLFLNSSVVFIPLLVLAAQDEWQSQPASEDSSPGDDDSAEEFGADAPDDSSDDDADVIDEVWHTPHHPVSGIEVQVNSQCHACNLCISRRSQLVGDDSRIAHPVHHVALHLQVDQASLRLYERSKLRYYYAIVEFDGITTATRVYTECDGLEFQLSSCKFDLRFVPDEQVGCYDMCAAEDAHSQLSAYQVCLADSPINSTYHDHRASRGVKCEMW
jgi:hypothetical protein